MGCWLLPGVIYLPALVYTDIVGVKQEGVKLEMDPILPYPQSFWSKSHLRVSTSSQSSCGSSLMLRCEPSAKTTSALKAYQGSNERQGHANGYKPKTVQTRMGDITFAILQVRDGGFYPQALEKGQRSERALTLTLAEMYVQGVSTRKVKAIVEQLCGSGVSSSTVSRAAAGLDENLQAWRNRPLGEIIYLFLDARYEKVRQDGQIRDAAILIAAGVDRLGKRHLLGVSVSLGEQEIH